MPEGNDDTRQTGYSLLVYGKDGVAFVHEHGLESYDRALAYLAGFSQSHQEKAAFVIIVDADAALPRNYPVGELQELGRSTAAELDMQDQVGRR